MSRWNLAEQETLEELIPRYAQNKMELDSYKDLCNKENARIKELMVEANETEHSAGGYTAKYIVQKKDSMDEEKLLSVLRNHGLFGLIKTVEVVDMDALENYLYNNTPSDKLAADIARCHTVKEVIQLRISKQKGE